MECTIRPKVRNNKGEFVDSVLFDDLCSFTQDIEKAKALWVFSRDMDKSSVALDVNGEPRIEAFLNTKEVSSMLTTDEMTNGLSSLYSKEMQEGTPNGFHKVAKACISFNNNSFVKEKYTANPVYDNGSCKMDFQPVSENTAERREEISKSEELYSFLSSWWQSRGFSIDALSEAEEGSGIDAVTDFSATRNIASGLIPLIRLAKGQRGQKAIAEETAHAVIAALHGKDQAVDRTINAFINNDELVRKALGDMYDTYHERYNGDQEKMAHEAVGHLLKDQIESEFENQKLKTHRSLLGRMKDAVLEFIKSFNEDPIEQAYRESLSTFKKVAKNIIGGYEYKEVDFGNYAQRFGELFALTKKGKDRVDEFVDKLISSLEGNINILSHSKNTGSRIKHKENTLANLRRHRKKGEALRAIMSYLNNMTGDLEYQIDTFDSKLKRKEGHLQDRGRIIYNVLNITKEYDAVLEDFYSTLDELTEYAGDNKDEKDLLEEMKKTVRETSYLCKSLRADAHKEALPTYIEFAKLFANDNIVVPFGEAYGLNEGEIVSIDEMMQHSKDPTLFEMFLSASQSSSFNVQVMGRIITMIKERVRKEAIAYTDILKQLTYNLEKAGYSNQDFMFERKDGKLTGNYIKKNSDEYKALSEVQRKYYDDVMEIKEQLDSKLPEGLTKLLNAPKVRKDFIEILKNSDDRVADLWDKAKDLGAIRSDSEYALKDENLVHTYDGQSLRTIPLRFLAFAEGEKKDNMSTDIVETLSMYAQMACNFASMYEAMPMLEIARGELAEGMITETTTTKSEVDGKIVTEKQRVDTKKRVNDKGQSRELERVNSLLDDQVYGIKMTDLGFVPGTKININAACHNLMAWTALNQYAFNPLGAAQNEITGLLMTRIEAAGGEFFNHSDLNFAHRTFISNLPDAIADFGNRIQTSKMNLFYRKFNVLQEDESREQNFNRKTKLGQVMNGRIPYWLTEGGEYNLHGLSALAVANHTKLKDADGNNISLWEALEVVDMMTSAERKLQRLIAEGNVEGAKNQKELMDKHPEWRGSDVKEIVLKEGVTKQDGTEFSDKDFDKMSRKMMQINHRLHGIYNDEDRAQIQNNVIGQMFLMYRKWIFPGLCRRFENLNYNQDYEGWTEGYYRSFGRFFFGNLKNYLSDNHEAIKSWDKLNDIEKRNIKRASWEIGIWLALSGLALFMRHLKKGTKEHTWYFSCLYYWSTRTLSEMNAYVPVGMPSETLRILRSPSAVLSTVDGIGNLGALLNPMNYESIAGDDALVKSGKYKGLSRAERGFWKSPILPGSHQWWSNSNPLDAAKFYEIFD